MIEPAENKSRNVPSGFKRRNGSEISMAELDTLDIPDVFDTVAVLGLQIGKAQKLGQALMLASLATDIAQATQLLIRESIVAFVELSDAKREMETVNSNAKMLSTSIRQIHNWIHSPEMEHDPELQGQQLGRDVCEWIVEYARNLRAENKRLNGLLEIYSPAQIRGMQRHRSVSGRPHLVILGSYSPGNTPTRKDTMEEITGMSSIPTTKHGESLLETCDKCEGCGRIANDEEGTPWSYWEGLPPGSDLAVKAGVVRPLTCPKCGGLGKVVISK